MGAWWVLLQEEAFRVDRFRGLEQGTGDYCWKTTHQKAGPLLSPPLAPRAHHLTIRRAAGWGGQVVADRVSAAKDQQLQQLRQELARLTAERAPRAPLSRVLS